MHACIINMTFSVEDTLLVCATPNALLMQFPAVVWSDLELLECLNRGVTL